MFAGSQLLYVPANRPFGLFGHAHCMLPRQQALRCLLGRNSFASLLIGPSVFRARVSHASPTAGPALFAGTKVVCVPANRPFGLFRHGHRMLPRRQAMQCLHATPTVFAWMQLVCSLQSSNSAIHAFGQLKCVWGAKMHQVCKLTFGLHTGNRQ